MQLFGIDLGEAALSIHAAVSWKLSQCDLPSEFSLGRFGFLLKDHPPASVSTDAAR